MQIVKLFEEGKFDLVYDRDSGQLVVIDKRGKIYGVSGTIKRRYLKFFPSLTKGNNFRKIIEKISSECWRERRKAEHPDRCFERAVGII